LSQVYEKFRVPKFGALAREMADAFLKIDLTGARMQTHATLSATRGILRLAEKDNDEALLKAAQKVFGLYVASGMTENFANFNWFSRPDTWTEPCAIVDSMMCALTLFRLTEDPYYARLANRIWYNGLGFAQRPNGGFGTDRCVGPAGDVLTPSSGGISEAYWCCTMRGAEGLRARAEGSFYVSADTDLTTFPDYQMIAHAPRKYDIWLPFSTDADYSCDFFTLKVRSSLPESGPVKITVKALAPLSLTLHIYTPDAPDGFRTRTLTLEPAESKTISETVNAEFSRVRSADGRKFKYMRGDLLLGLTEPKDAANPLSAAGFQPGDELSEELKAKLRPVNDVIDLSFDDAANTQRRLLF